MVSRARPARFGSGPVGGRIFALLAVTALLVAGSPGSAYADDGRPQANPEERAAALIRPAVMYIVIGAYGWVRLPTASGSPTTATTRPSRSPRAGVAPRSP
ncbi:hypothetical protein MSHO_26780 [Mycobacterium shottsii]|uniref:Uncharacterized protein n=1 Tax=Mycobacterium shottsii TaxID=133549 RepID=A0A7I7LDH5_9MYCO|nr:hypothetical protein MSHO_26780 [Mycobacterium shottsii]